jgi:ABC transporter substrate binding protein
LIADVAWADEDVRGPTVLAVELVQSKVDVLVAEGTEATLRAAVAAGPDIPTVMVAINTDPIARGYIKSLARPGGTVTGVFARQPELAEKQVELLAQTFPERTRLAVFYAEGSSEQFIAAERRAQLLTSVPCAPPSGKFGCRPPPSHLPSRCGGVSRSTSLPWRRCSPGPLCSARRHWSSATGCAGPASCSRDAF